MLHHVITFALPFAGVCAAQLGRRFLIVAETVALRVAIDIGKERIAARHSVKEIGAIAEGVEIAVSDMAEKVCEDL